MARIDVGRLAGKVALITGAASGLGAAHAKLFVTEGARVILTDIALDAGRALAGELGPNALFVDHDVVDPQAWESVVRIATDAFGPVTVLVNNAGIAGPSAKTLEISQQDYLKTIDVDQHGVFYGMRAVLPGMIAAGGGSIVNMSSAAGIVATPGAPNIAYIAAKFAVRGMTKAAAVDYADKKVRVNSVHPGGILTPLAEALLDSGGPQMRAAFEATVPMKRFGQPIEIAQIVLFLASDESSYATGAEFIFDGGLTAI